MIDQRLKRAEITAKKTRLSRLWLILLCLKDTDQYLESPSKHNPISSLLTSSATMEFVSEAVYKQKLKMEQNDIITNVVTLT